MTPGQRVHVTGEMFGEAVDADTVFHPYVLSFERTDGANFYSVNYVAQESLWEGPRGLRATAIGKVGAGILLPRTAAILFYEELDKNYRVAGYLVSAEAGVRFYATRHFFLEATGKGGYADFRNVLTVAGGRAAHNLWFGEAVGLLGLEVGFKKGRGKSE